MNGDGWFMVFYIAPFPQGEGLKKPTVFGTSGDTLKLRREDYNITSCGICPF